MSIFRAVISSSLVSRRLLIANVMLTAATLGLSGCGVGTVAPSSASAAASVEGNVYGGSTPVSGSHVYVFAAGTSGYPEGLPNQGLSTSLLTANTAGSDSVGGYVLSNSSGGFSIPAGSYTCTSGQQVYILAIGGNPGLGAGGSNPNLSLMSLLGDCPAAGNFAATVPYVWINEASTVASVYALAGFIQDGRHVSSSGTALANAQIKIAFSAVNNLINVATGTTRATTAFGNGVVAQAKVDTLANILVACVNSNGTTSACNTLFANAQNSALTSATDTVMAMVNIAHAPFSNVSALFGVQGGAPAYVPALSSAPADFSLPILYTIAVAGGQAIAVDGGGNLWVGGPNTTQIAKISPLGVPLITSQTMWTTGGTFSLAIDTANSVWATNQGSLTFKKITSAGVTTVPETTVPNATGIEFGAVDASNSYWVETHGPTEQLSEFTSSGVANGGPYTVAGTTMDGLGIDVNGYLWSGSSTSTNGTVTTSAGANQALFSTGTATQEVVIGAAGKAYYASASTTLMPVASLSGTTITTTTFSGGPGKGTSLSVDGANEIWYSSASGNVSGYTSGGQVFGSATGFSASGSNTMYGAVAIDGCGNVWAGGVNSTTLTEFVGLALPVYVPLNPNHTGILP